MPALTGRRLRRGLGWLGIALAIAAAAPAPIVGPARVVDGDTFILAGVRVRLWGVDAPEGAQTCRDAVGRDYACGAVSAARLRALIGGEAVSCVVRAHDPYGRAVAQCRVRDQDLGGALVAAGQAVEEPSFDGGAYAPAEAEARRARRGLWAGRFEPPWRWRAAHRELAATAPQADGPAGCPFKGNINAGGRRIVHAPGQRDYAATRIDPARGERWFCSREAAQAAGWVPARR